MGSIDVKKTVSFLLTLSVITVLLLTGPASAIRLVITIPQESFEMSEEIIFTVEVEIEQNDFLTSDGIFTVTVTDNTSLHICSFSIDGSFITCDDQRFVQVIPHIDAPRKMGESMSGYGYGQGYVPGQGNVSHGYWYVNSSYSVYGYGYGFDLESANTLSYTVTFIPEMPGTHLVDFNASFQVESGKFFTFTTQPASFDVNPLAPEIYTVTFEDYDETILDIQEIEHGNDATEPDHPIREGYTFTGWDTDFTNVVSNLTIRAQYDVNSYNLTFIDYDASIIQQTSYEFGALLDGHTMPQDPTREGYTFIGWSSEVPETMPADDIIITAMYEINTYMVIITVTDEEDNPINASLIKIIGQDQLMTNITGSAHISLPDGNYSFNVSKDGFIAQIGLNFTVAGETAYINVTLVEDPGPFYIVMFNLTPEDASVTVRDDAQLTRTPLPDDRYELPAGSYTYTVSRSGYQTKTEGFTLTDDNLTITVVLELSPSSGGGSSRSGGSAFSPPPPQEEEQQDPFEQQEDPSDQIDEQEPLLDIQSLIRDALGEQASGLEHDQLAELYVFLEKIADVLEHTRHLVIVDLEEDLDDDLSDKEAFIAERFSIAREDLRFLAYTHTPIKTASTSQSDEPTQEMISRSLRDKGYHDMLLQRPLSVSSQIVITVIATEDDREFAIVDFVYTLSFGDHVIEIPAAIAATAEKIAGIFEVIRENPILLFRQTDTIRFRIGTEDISELAGYMAFSDDVAITSLIQSRPAEEYVHDETVEEQGDKPRWLLYIVISLAFAIFMIAFLFIADTTVSRIGLGGIHEKENAKNPFQAGLEVPLRERKIRDESAYELLEQPEIEVLFALYKKAPKNEIDRIIHKPNLKKNIADSLVRLYPYFERKTSSEDYCEEDMKIKIARSGYDPYLVDYYLQFKDLMSYAEKIKPGILELKRQGKSEEDIRSYYSSAGWKSPVIDAAFILIPDDLRRLKP